jgi:hypothetical protein
LLIYLFVLFSLSLFLLLLLEYSNITCFKNLPNLYESQFGGTGIIFSKSWKRENHLQIQDVITFIGNSRAMNLTKLNHVPAEHNARILQEPRIISAYPTTYLKRHEVLSRR